MPRPKKQTRRLLANLPILMLDSIRKDCIEKGYTVNHRGSLAPHWQGYLGAVFGQIISGKWVVPRKDTDTP